VPREFAIALCLVILIEGLVLFAAPRAWQQMVQQLSEVQPQRLRAIGGMAMIIGLLLLQAVR